MKHLLSYVEIYITNVCNYSCAHCQSLNNFAFKGHQRWEDYKEDYRLLSNQLDVDTIQIIGGEPTLNPDFEKWVNGISTLWPNSKLQISTNGSRLDKLTKDIYESLLRHKGTLWLTCHDISLYDKMLSFAREFLDEIVSEYQPDKHADDNWNFTYTSVRDKDWPDCDVIEQFASLPDDIRKQFSDRYKDTTSLHPKTVCKMLIDKNGVEVRLDWSQAFVSSVVSVVNDGRLSLQGDNDPIEAHNICHFKTCHQLNKGKLYKCPLVSILPDFLNQFDVSMSDEDKILAYSYKSLSSGDSNVSEFINVINKPIDQCKFCSNSYAKKHNFIGTDKKIKIFPITQ